MLGNSSFTQNGATNRREGATSLLSLLRKKPAPVVAPTPAPAPAPVSKPAPVVTPKPTVTKTTTTAKAPTPGLLNTTSNAPKVDTVSNAQRVIETGTQTPLEKTATEKVYTASGPTPLEKSYIDRVVEATKMQTAGRLGQYADAPLYAGQTPENQFRGLIEAPDLAARGVANAGLYNTLGDIYGNAATQGLLAANTIAQRGLEGATTGLSGAQTVAERAKGGAESVLTAGLPGQAPYTSYRYNPLTGETIGEATPFAGGAQAGLVALGQQYPELLSAHVQSQGIKNTIQSYLAQNPSLNPSDASVVNSALQWAQGKQLSDPRYQTLMNYLNEYTNTLAPILGVGGSVTNLKTEIANSFLNAAASGKSIAQVLEDIDRLAEGKLQSMANVGSGVNEPSNIGTSSGGGGFAETW